MSETVWAGTTRYLVTAQMYDEIRAARHRGARLWLGLVDVGPAGACTNCGGPGRLVLQMAAGGPWDAAPTGKAAPIIYQDGQWYTVRTKTYRCPVCAPVEERGERVAEVVL